MKRAHRMKTGTHVHTTKGPGRIVRRFGLHTFSVILPDGRTIIEWERNITPVEPDTPPTQTPPEAPHPGLFGSRNHPR